MSAGEKIKHYRKLRGMYQSELAEKVSLTEGPSNIMRAAPEPQAFPGRRLSKSIGHFASVAEGLWGRKREGPACPHASV